MNYGASLPLTGAGIAIGGIVFDQGALIGVALSAIFVGALAIRWSFRRGREATEV